MRKLSESSKSLSPSILEFHPQCTCVCNWWSHGWIGSSFVLCVSMSHSFLYANVPSSVVTQYNCQIQGPVLFRLVPVRLNTSVTVYTHCLVPPHPTPKAFGNPTSVDFVGGSEHQMIASYTAAKCVIYDLETGKSVLNLDSASTYGEFPKLLESTWCSRPQESFRGSLQLG